MSEVRARVICQEKGLYRISSELGECLAEVSGKFRYEAAFAADFPAVGDYVVAAWPQKGSRGIISMVFPRRTCFIRRAAGVEAVAQVVAANIDYAFLCMSLNNDFSLRRLERYLAIAWDSGAAPIVLLTKKDLCPNPQAQAAQVGQLAPGVEIHTVSSLDESAEEIANLLEPGKTYAFLGSSGVGKSTLINRLSGGELKTGGLRNDDKGRHTTTHRELITLPCGACLIDTPGMRELGMFESGDGLDTVFTDIETLAQSCRFSNCSHNGEPGCAIAAALGDGTLAPDRWESFRKLKKENAYTGDQAEYLKMKKEKFKAISKTNKHR